MLPTSLHSRRRAWAGAPPPAVALLALALTASAAVPEPQAVPRARTSFEARATVFRPGDAVFRDIYGSGFSWGGELAVEISPSFALWAGGDYYSKTGTLAFTGEVARIRVVPLAAGARIQFPLAGTRAYLGAGLGYFRYREASPIALVEGGKVGFVGRAGVLVDLGNVFFLDAQASYSFCSVTPLGSDIRADLGGFRGGLGAGFRF